MLAEANNETSLIMEVKEKSSSAMNSRAVIDRVMVL